MSGTLSSNTFRMAVVAFERKGLDVSPILEKCKVSKETLENVWARIPIEKEQTFWKLACDATGDLQIGLNLGSQVPFGTFPLLEYVGASSPSLLHALHLLTRYSKIVYGNWNPEIDENEKRIEFRLGAEGDPEVSRHTTEFTFTVLWMRLQEFANADLSLNSIHFRHSLHGEINRYHAIFGENIFFDATEDLMIFPATFANVPCKNSNPLALGSLIHGVDALFNKLILDYSSSGGPSGQALIRSLRDEISLQLSAGEISSDQIAKNLGISKRTLQRRLETEGRSLRALVSEMRRDLATKLLKESEESVEQIALRIGYSDLKAFSRAFTEWYGMSPTAFRKSQR